MLMYVRFAWFVLLCEVDEICISEAADAGAVVPTVGAVGVAEVVVVAVADVLALILETADAALVFKLGFVTPLKLADLLVKGCV